MLYIFKDKKALFFLLIYLFLCFFIGNMSVSAKELYDFSGNYIYYSPYFTQPYKDRDLHPFNPDTSFNNAQGSKDVYFKNSTYDEYPFLFNYIRDYRDGVDSDTVNKDKDFTKPHLTKQEFYLYLDDFTEDDYNNIINSKKSFYVFGLIRAKYYYDISNNSYFSLCYDYNRCPDFYFTTSNKIHHFGSSSSIKFSKEFDPKLEKSLVVYNEFITLQLEFKYENLNSFPIYYSSSAKKYFFKFNIEYPVDSITDYDTLDIYPYIPEFNNKISTFQFDKLFISDDIKDLALVSFDNYSNSNGDVFYEEHEFLYPVEQDTNESKPDDRNFWEKLVDFFTDSLGKLFYSLFVPHSDFYYEKLEQMKSVFNEKFGLLALPIQVLSDILNKFSDLGTSSSRFVINVPDYTIPGFKTPILHKQSYDLMNVLNKPEIHNLWYLYLDFIDVFLIVAFLNLSYNKLMSFFGGITTETDVVSVDDYDTYDRATGEQISSRRVESHRKSTRNTRRKL